MACLGKIETRYGLASALILKKETTQLHIDIAVDGRKQSEKVSRITPKRRGKKIPSRQAIFIGKNGDAIEWPSILNC
jgi:hypothetical protein